MYRQLWLYYSAIILNFLLRALWTMSLIPQGSSESYTKLDQLAPFLAMFELLRRCIWSCFRLELEHLNLNKENIVHYHLERKVSYGNNMGQMLNHMNKSTKVAVYHLLLGVFVLFSVSVIVMSLE
jgi:hypothetical protein